MFAEELLVKNEKAKKKQDAARAARKRALLLAAKKKKREQEQKEKQVTAAEANKHEEQNDSGVRKESNSITEKNAQVSSLDLHENQSNLNAAVAVSAPDSTRKHQSMDAVQVAMEQRKIRQNRHLEVSSAVRIQSLYRGMASRKKTFSDQTALFDGRISDIETLRRIVMKAASTKGGNGNVYAPPPATASILTSQFIFIFDNHKRIHEVIASEFWIRFGQLLIYILIPGIDRKCNSQENTASSNPLLPWIDDFCGKRRVQKILRMILYFYTCRGLVLPNQSNEISTDHFVLEAVEIYLREILLHKKGCCERVVQFCQYLCGLNDIMPPNVSN